MCRALLWIWRLVNSAWDSESELPVVQRAAKQKEAAEAPVKDMEDGDTDEEQDEGAVLVPETPQKASRTTRGARNAAKAGKGDDDDDGYAIHFSFLDTSSTSCFQRGYTQTGQRRATSRCAQVGAQAYR